MRINFYPESDLKDYTQAVNEFKDIWNQEGHKMVDAWESATGLKFEESEINAVVLDSRSHSHPLSLRSNLDSDAKKTVLLHELGHRILYKRIPGGKEADSLIRHKFLFLRLYDLAQKLYGVDLANRMVQYDMERQDYYKAAWDWALGFDENVRAQKFKDALVNGYSVLE